MSRRAFLAGAPLGALGGVAVAVVTGKLLRTVLGGRRTPPKFPEGSIFTPAKDRDRT